MKFCEKIYYIYIILLYSYNAYTTNQSVTAGCISSSIPLRCYSVSQRDIWKQYISQLHNLSSKIKDWCFLHFVAATISDCSTRVPRCRKYGQLYHVNFLWLHCVWRNTSEYQKLFNNTRHIKLIFLTSATAREPAVRLVLQPFTANWQLELAAVRCYFINT